ncbi:MAG: DinB family protein [Roseiflexaceae bacterium]
MNTISTMFMQRYTPLTEFYLEGFWQYVSPDQMRQRPHQRVNSIAWVMWHIARVEDAGLNRFVMQQPQVLDSGDWTTQMNLPWRHHGGEMTLSEVDELSARIDLDGLHRYMQAVQTRTRAIVATLDETILAQPLDVAFVQQVVVDEGLVLRNATGFVTNYASWGKGKCLMTFALTHPFQHVGEMETIASLMNITFD